MSLLKTFRRIFVSRYWTHYLLLKSNDRFWQKFVTHEKTTYYPPEFFFNVKSFLIITARMMEKYMCNRILFSFMLHLLSSYRILQLLNATKRSALYSNSHPQCWGTKFNKERKFHITQIIRFDKINTSKSEVYSIA